ncbi:hypothetical protein GV819_08515 [Pseudomonas sp. Fl5BN2]|uniref:hypothetical protein n=1 Tax=unclassified Pseudomonas TaxID=196821 RepID=UPI001377927C|nr:MULTISPECIES: hypothetical protein [unclassified Pseudomonas]NBF02335.1 hypothetical protein [Pseudomonas sp. Fl5BN2]NBF11976.1 hypothetical protein [Pseudomonas sp. Fl4BN1]
MLEALESGLDEPLSCLLRAGADIESVRDVLVSYRDKGFAAEAVYNYLASLRLGASQVLEDRVLEAMDIASGYCSEGARVWDLAQ